MPGSPGRCNSPACRSLPEIRNNVDFDRQIRHGSARANADGHPMRGRYYLHAQRVPLDQIDPGQPETADVTNLGDIRTVDWSTVAPVDIVTAGFPCQDISNAGKRAGITGVRSSVWTAVVAVVRALRPALVYVEFPGVPVSAMPLSCADTKRTCPRRVRGDAGSACHADEIDRPWLTVNELGKGGDDPPRAERALSATNADAVVVIRDLFSGAPANARVAPWWTTPSR